MQSNTTQQSAAQWPQWPGHYTQADIDLITRMAGWIRQRNYTQAALARLARVSGSSLNQIMKGSYATSPAKLLAALDQAMRHAEEAASHTTIQMVETSVFKLAYTACQMARRYRNFAVFTGYVGTGKTAALKHYARTHANTHIIEATPTMTPQSLVKLLARVVAGYTAKGSMDDRFQAVIDTLRNTDSLLIVDEAETLTAHQLHTLRRVRDLANVGIVLSGTEHLSGLIKPEHGQFDQIRSRAGFWPATVQGISADDAGALVQSAFGAEELDDAVIARMYAYCKGSARMLCEGLVAGIREFRKGRPLDVKLVDAVAKQALCLQSLA